MPSLITVFLAHGVCVVLCSHYPHLSSRAAAALLKAAITDCMRFNGCPLPHDEDSSSFIGEYHQSYDNDAQNVFDRLFFLAVPLSCVFPGPAFLSGAAANSASSSQHQKESSAGSAPQKSRRPPSPPDALSTKPHLMLESALQMLVSEWASTIHLYTRHSHYVCVSKVCLCTVWFVVVRWQLDTRHLGLLLNSSDVNDASLLANKPWRPITPDDADTDSMRSKPASEILRTYSPLLAVTKVRAMSIVSPRVTCMTCVQALVLQKDPVLHDRILDLVTADAAASQAQDREAVGSPRRVQQQQVRQVKSGRAMSFFYDVFINECLLRGLSGLFPLDATQFVWDQCFVTGDLHCHTCSDVM
jgi:hypothetical protein